MYIGGGAPCFNKERIYVNVVDPHTGARVAECVLRHVLLHELAHTVNREHGHGSRFQRMMAWMQRGVAALCPGRVPADYNPCRDG